MDITTIEIREDFDPVTTALVALVLLALVLVVARWARAH